MNIATWTRTGEVIDYNKQYSESPKQQTTKSTATTILPADSHILIRIRISSLLYELSMLRYLPVCLCPTNRRILSLDPQTRMVNQKLINYAPYNKFIRGPVHDLGQCMFTYWQTKYEGAQLFCLKNLGHLAEYRYESRLVRTCPCDVSSSRF